MTDVSISDVERISHEDLDKKIKQLGYYIDRVGQRMSVLNNFSNNSTKVKRKQKKSLKN